jgi:glutaredoxin-related protein
MVNITGKMANIKRFGEYKTTMANIKGFVEYKVTTANRT